MKDILHAELDTWSCKWHMIVILHQMIDHEMITKLECQFFECMYDSRSFKFDLLNKNGDGRGNKLGPVLDHVIPQREGGLHRIENLRLLHRGCNSSWRRGLTGSFHTDESRRKISLLTTQQHLDGRIQDYSDTVRNAKIAQAMSGTAGTLRALKGWETRRARLRSSG